MKILVIQQKMIGDVLTSSILFEALKTKFPNSKLYYLINSYTFPVVEHNPFIDSFIFYTPEMEKSRQKLFALAKRVRNEEFDVVIDVYSKTSSNVITFFSKASKKISEKKWYSKWIYTHTFERLAIPSTNAGLAIENRMQLLKAMDISNAIYKPKIYLTKKEKQQAERSLIAHKIDPSKPLFMISVLGSEEEKTYPPDYMAIVIDQIVSHTNATILFNYIPNQENEAKKVFNYCSAATQKNICFSLFGKSLREFMALTSHCNALIGNEGGAVHMAKALEVPTFTIFSPWIDKNAWLMFDDEQKHVSVHLNDYCAEPYKDVTQVKHLKKEALNLFKTFKPNLFESKLTSFLNQF